MAEAWVGTSGWSYKHWQGRFYPDKVLGTRPPPFFAEHFRTGQINYSYYQLPARKVFGGGRGGLEKKARPYLFPVPAPLGFCPAAPCRVFRGLAGAPRPSLRLRVPP